MQTNPAVEQNKNIKWSESPWNQSGTAVLADTSIQTPTIWQWTDQWQRTWQAIAVVKRLSDNR